MRLIIISGVSGGGKSVALHALEDLGYFAIDNLPLNLLPALADELSRGAESPVERAAAVVDVRDPRQGLGGFPGLVEQLREQEVEPEVLFLEADYEVLVARFSETRRRHPLTGSGLPLREALIEEAKLLGPVRQCAARILDTSTTNVHELRRMVQEQVGRRPGDGMSVLLQSFGFKYGAPHDVDMQFDVRCLPNPYWVEELRSSSGRDADVQAFLDGSEEVGAMVEQLSDFLARWIPSFAHENRAYLTVAVGCTGGRHRSVYVVEALAARLRSRYPHLLVRHRELDGAILPG
jgi:UPF0042 nucleotide-binding protein